MAKSIDFYKKTNDLSLATLLATQSPLLDNHWNNISFTRSSANKQDEAKIQRFNCGVSFDVYAPQVSIDSNELVLQAKNEHNQVFHSQTSSINRWTRAQNINVLQAENNYTYVETQNFVGSGVHIDHISKHEAYADYHRLQIGQKSSTPISNKSSVGSKYGIYEVGSINDMKFTSKNKAISLNSKTGIANVTSGTFNVKAKKGISMSSPVGITMNTGGEFIANSTGPFIMGSSSLMVINSGGAIYMDAPVVFVGMASFMGGKTPLDIASGVVLPSFTSTLTNTLSNVVGGLMTGDIGGVLVSAVGAFAPGAVSSFLNGTDFNVGDMIGSGLSNMVTDAIGNVGGELLSNTVSKVVGGTLSGAVNGLIGGGIDGLFGGAVDALTGGVTGVLTDAVDSLIPGFSDVLSGDISGALGSVLGATGILDSIPGADAFFGLLGGDSGGNAFNFKVYPKLEPIDYYPTAPIPKSTPQVTYGLDTENVFPTFFSIPTMEPENPDQASGEPTTGDVTNNNSDIA